MGGELLIEGRWEELPASTIQPALAGLRDGVLGLLKGVPHGEVSLFSTPRRLAVAIADVAPARPQEVKLVTGPPLAAAKRDGEWTRAAQGFARGKGVSVDELEVVEGPRGQVIAARTTSGGERTAALLAGGLDRVLRNLPSKKSMRWGSGDVRFARPLHQLLAVLDGERIPATAATLETTTAVVGHRQSPAEPAPVATAEQYLVALEERWVLAHRATPRPPKGSSSASTTPSSRRSRTSWSGRWWWSASSTPTCSSSRTGSSRSRCGCTSAPSPPGTGTP